MRLGVIVAVVLLAGMAAGAGAQAPAPALPTPGFHHVHLNSPSPAAAVAGYVKAHPSNTAVTVAGFQGFRTTNNVYFLFSRVDAPPPVMAPDHISARNPQTSFWHFVFPVQDLRQTLARFHSEVPDFSRRILPLYTGPDGHTVEMSGDALPGFLTVEQMTEARAKGVKPTGVGGYITWLGPDGAVMEASQGPVEKLTIFGMFQEQPYCALFWYQKHLNAPPPAARGGGPSRGPASEADCVISKSTVVSYPSTYKRGHVRVPPAMGVNFSDVFVRWYMNQESTPLAPMRGGVVDHFALSVADLDAWIAKLRSENVKFLEGPAPYRFGDTRAVMIEGPSREAIELVEVRN